MTSSCLPEWAHALNNPPAGHFKQAPEQFVVVEQLGFEPEQRGDHLWCWIEKRGVETHRAITLCAKEFGVRERDVGYSGLKDRMALTRQWLSFPLSEPPMQQSLDRLAEQGIKVLSAVPHPRKLKRGSHRSNRFEIAIEFDASDAEQVFERWQRLQQTGAPNYFGAQRFGHAGLNIERARHLLAKGWHKRADKHGMLLSSARSYLFNLTLAARVSADSWHTPLAGEVVNLDGSGSFFSSADAALDELTERAAVQDIHPTAPLWGKGQLDSFAQAREVELHSVLQEQQLIAGLERAGVAMARRALRLRVLDPTWQRTERGALLGFGLVRGGYATAVLRELIAAPGL
ncbi:tRNA pseudouridine synthase D [Carnimonas sp. R-84981]|uniref:tRNA pseudouridine(13) synthase TruD n=1 Tax=Carnimonas bestiolae TaxID=3402172 RepID=UPI003EDC640E